MLSADRKGIRLFLAKFLSQGQRKEEISIEGM